MDWSQAGRAHELAEDLSEPAIWLLVRLRSTTKKTEGRFNSKSLGNQTYIRKTFESVGVILGDVINELVRANLIIPQGGTRYQKTSDANTIEHQFRNALAEGALQGEIHRDVAEVPDGIRQARDILYRKSLEFGR